MTLRRLPFVLSSRRAPGISLIEVIFAAAVLALVAVGYLGALSVSVGVNFQSSNQTEAFNLGQREMELLRAAPFAQLPYLQTSTPEDMEEVPDYLTNLVTEAVLVQANAFVRSTGTHPEYSAEAIADGLRMDETQVKWVGAENGPKAVPGGDWPGEIDNPRDIIIVGGGGSGLGGVFNPQTGGNGPGEPVVPTDSQWVYIAFDQPQRAHRVIYDSRYNTGGDLALVGNLELPVDKDGRHQTPGIYQRGWNLFTSLSDLRGGVILNPAVHPLSVFESVLDGSIMDAGVHVSYDAVTAPLEFTVLGAGNIHTLDAADPAFHYPYVGEIEAYGFNAATAYVPEFAEETGRLSGGNYVMFFENYGGSDFDLARRVFVDQSVVAWPPSDKVSFFEVEVEVMAHESARNTKAFMEQTWWQSDDSEVVKLAGAIYADGTVTGGVLPALPDTVELAFDNTNYRSKEDFAIPITVPGATAIRLHFDRFGLERDPDTDFVQFYDIEGNQYGEPQYFGAPGDLANLENLFSPWVPGDTIVVRFHSDEDGSSLAPASFTGVRVDFVELNGVPTDPTAPAAVILPEVLDIFRTDVFPKVPIERVPLAERDEAIDFFAANESTEAPLTEDPESGENSIFDLSDFDFASEVTP